MSDKQSPVLSVEDLQVFYWTKRGPIRAVDGVSFSIQRNERFGLFLARPMIAAAKHGFSCLGELRV